MRKLVGLVFVVGCVSMVIGRETSVETHKGPQPVTFTAEEDHTHMMSQLGIKMLRPGPSGNISAPNHANYDESTANPCPQLPDALTTKDGQKVNSEDTWWNIRRPEIVEDFEREVYGRLPKNIPGVTWTIKITDQEFVGHLPVDIDIEYCG